MMTLWQSTIKTVMVIILPQSPPLLFLLDSCKLNQTNLSLSLEFLQVMIRVECRCSEWLSPVAATMNRQWLTMNEIAISFISAVSCFDVLHQFEQELFECFVSSCLLVLLIVVTRVT